MHEGPLTARRPDPSPVDVVARLAARGESTGRYAYEEEIARGGMGAIHRVWDADLQRALAMKVLPATDESSPQDPDLPRELRRLGRFLEEAQITGRLDHPGVVPVHELGLDSHGRLYFTMKLVEGRTLREVFDLVRDGQDEWTRTRALGVLHRVCEAMAYAHHKGVLHRDLKPGNVMVGRFGEVYVMDWGLARVLGENGRPGASSGAIEETSSPLETLEGDVVGTPAYMSPEQAEGSLAQVGPCSDVYAVGAMLYHLLSGGTPYVRPGESVGGRAILERVRAGPPPPIEALAPDAPAELLAICRKAMARDLPARYGDMAALSADLAAYLEGRVVRAHETGTWAEARKWVQRNKALSGALLTAAIALVVGLIVSLSLKASSDANSFRAEKVASFLEETLGGVSPSVARGRDTAMLREMMDAAWARIERGELAPAPEAELRLMRLIGNAYRDVAEYDAAEPILRQALAKARALFPADHVELALNVTSLAELVQLRGELAAAESLYSEALEMNRRLFPGDHPEVANSLGNLASTLHLRGDLAGAERLMRQALEMNERLQPGDHRAVALNLENLAVVILARGDVDGAEDSCRRALEMLQRLYPSDHPDVATTLDQLGNVLQARGDLDGAEPVHRRSLEMQRRLLPGDAPETASSLNNLASVLYRRGDVEGGEALFREGLEMQQRMFPGDHARVATSMANLAAMAHSRSDLDAAEPLYRQALDMQRRLFPGGHPDIPTTLNNFAVLLLVREDFAGAEEFVREGLEMQRRLTPGDHEMVAGLLESLASVLRFRGDHAGADAVSREALQMQGRLTASK
ncbi:MAG: tetratricopeptide repeat protein [Planctomycetota bacterium]